MLTLLLFCGSAVLLAIHYIVNINKQYWNKRNVVEVRNAAWDFVFGKCSLPEVYKKLYDAFPSENHVGMYLSFKPVLVLRNLEDIQAVLVTEFQSFYGRGYVVNPNDFLADNLLLINDYSRGKLVRQKISPIFTKLKLKNMYHMIKRCTLDFLSCFRHNSQLMQDPLQALSKFSSASISASILGIDSKTKNCMESPLLDFAWDAADTSSTFTLKIALCTVFPKLFNLLNFSMFGSHEKVVLEVMHKILKSRQELSNKGLDFVSVCLDMQNAGVLQDNTTGYEIKPTDEFLAAQAFSFFVAGVDTSANAINFTLLELANNQSILHKVHKEIDETFENTDSLSYQDIDNLAYLDMVFDESLRKYPPIASLQRECAKDTILPTNLKVERGTILVIPIYGLHMDEKYFPKPHVFEPERFSGENISKINKLAYLPFGSGSHICIGAKYARLQIKTALALLLREFTLNSCMYSVKYFEPSCFNLRDSRAKYDIVPRSGPIGHPAPSVSNNII